jgi:hypothetical protein
VGLKFPDPAEYLKMVDPESVMMVESMAVGRQHLQDSGYGTSEKDEKNEDESKMDSEQKLAPWIMTKTYLHSQRDKAWVQLYGEGDPTGRGEGFSFIKVSMKDIFLREGETAEDRKGAFDGLPCHPQGHFDLTPSVPSAQPSLHRHAAQVAAEAGPHRPGADFPARGSPHLGRPGGRPLVAHATRADRGGGVPRAGRPQPGVDVGRPEWTGRQRRQLGRRTLLARLLSLLERQHASAALARRDEPRELGRPR